MRKTANNVNRKTAERNPKRTEDHAYEAAKQGSQPSRSPRSQTEPRQEQKHRKRSKFLKHQSNVTIQAKHHNVNRPRTRRLRKLIRAQHRQALPTKQGPHRSLPQNKAQPTRRQRRARQAIRHPIRTQATKHQSSTPTHPNHQHQRKKGAHTSRHNTHPSRTRRHAQKATTATQAKPNKQSNAVDTNPTGPISQLRRTTGRFGSDNIVRLTIRKLLLRKITHSLHQYSATAINYIRLST